MFADNTNPFYCHHQIKILFETVNCELGKINQWFKANRLSLNLIILKSILSLTVFHKNSIKDKIPLKMPSLKIGNKIFERTSSIKFLACYIARNNSLMKLL